MVVNPGPGRFAMLLVAMGVLTFATTLIWVLDAYDGSLVAVSTDGPVGRDR
jgi:hypothetical protein